MPTTVENRTLTSSAPLLLRIASNTFFYGYVGLLVIAGAWGVWFARVDMSWLFHIRLETLDPVAQASLLSQYRFLRAIELAFGLWALSRRHAIHTEKAPNRLFLLGMGAGVLGRLISLPMDGRPLWPMFFFMITELLGVVLIFTYTRFTLRPRQLPSVTAGKKGNDAGGQP